MTGLLFFASGWLVGTGVTMLGAYSIGRQMRRSYERAADDARRAGRLDGILEVDNELRAFGIKRFPAP